MGFGDTIELQLSMFLLILLKRNVVIILLGKAFDLVLVPSN